MSHNALNLNNRSANVQGKLGRELVYSNFPFTRNYGLFLGSRLVPAGTLIPFYRYPTYMAEYLGNNVSVAMSSNGMIDPQYLNIWFDKLVLPSGEFYIEIHQTGQSASTGTGRYALIDTTTNERLSPVCSMRDHQRNSMVLGYKKSDKPFEIGVVVVDGSVNAVHDAGLPRFSYNVFKH